MLFKIPEQYSISLFLSNRPVTKPCLEEPSHVVSQVVPPTLEMAEMSLREQSPVHKTGTSLQEQPPVHETGTSLQKQSPVHKTGTSLQEQPPIHKTGTTGKQ